MTAVAKDDVVVEPYTRRRVPRLNWFRLGDAASSVSLIVLLIIVWAIVDAVFQVPSYLLPSPWKVWSDIWDPSYRWASAGWITAQESIGGFLVAAIGGILLGVVVTWSKFLGTTILPFLVFFNTLPKVAVAPLFIVYLGYGVLPNLVIAAIVAFFPVVLNTATGLLQTDRDLVDLAHSLRAPKWRVFFTIRLPSAVPFILSGLKVSTTLAMTGAVFGEFIASQSGLGNLIQGSQTSLNMSAAFAALFWLSVLGMGMYGAVALFGRIVFPWAGQAKPVGE